MENKKRKAIISVIVLSILILLFGALSSWSVARCVVLLNGKNRTAAIIAFICLLVVFLGFIGLFWFLLIFPKITKKNSYLVAFLKKHFVFWLLLGAAVVWYANGIENACAIERDAVTMSNLIMIEWTIFGIAVALYALLHLSFAKTSALLRSNTIDDQVVFTFVVFILDLCLLIITTTYFYMEGKMDTLTSILANVTFVSSEFAILHIMVNVVFSFAVDRLQAEQSDDFYHEQPTDAANQTIVKTKEETSKGNAIDNKTK